MAVALLILNDWYLKAVFGNTLTGKLSDFAGLTAFTIFWAALLPRWRRTVFIGTAAAFILWKSPLSEGPLTAWNVESRRPYAAPTDDEVTLTVYIRQPPERPVAVIVRLREVQPGRTDMMLLSAATTTGLRLEQEAVHRAFNTQVYEPLLAFLTSREQR
jgi:hypothetical protein